VLQDDRLRDGDIFMLGGQTSKRDETELELQREQYQEVVVQAGLSNSLVVELDLL
jgi:hypothetical protein